MGLDRGHGNSNPQTWCLCRWPVDDQRGGSGAGPSSCGSRGEPGGHRVLRSRVHVVVTWSDDDVGRQWWTHGPAQKNPDSNAAGGRRKLQPKRSGGLAKNGMTGCKQAFRQVDGPRPHDFAHDFGFTDSDLVNYGY